MSETDPPSLILSRKQKPTAKKPASATATTEKGAVSEVRTEPVGDQGNSSVGDPNMSETDPPTLISSQKQNPTAKSQVDTTHASGSHPTVPSAKARSISSHASKTITHSVIHRQVTSVSNAGRAVSQDQVDPSKKVKNSY
jgi:hypothetical protein